MKSTAVVLCALLVLVTASASAQSVLDRSHVLGLGLQTAFPYNELDEAANTGWGVFGTVDYPLVPLLDATAHVAWNTFPGQGDNPSVEVWEVTAGARLAFGTFFMGGEVGWYDRGDEWSWVPSIGLRFDRIEMALRWRSVGTNAFTSAGAAWYF